MPVKLAKAEKNKWSLFRRVTF